MKLIVHILVIFACVNCAPTLKLDVGIYAPDLHNVEGRAHSTAVDNTTNFGTPFAGNRPGNPSDDDACDTVLNYIPRHLTFITRYNYYSKYTHAYGIPILGRGTSDAALKRACYVVKFLLADRYTIRYYLYKNYGRVGIMASNEGTTSIPEHRFLGSWWDTRARGLGGTLAIPISTGGEENLLCWSNDRYRVEDIFLHEFSHGIQEIAVTAGIRGYNSRLQQAYNWARSRGLWRNTYAMDTWKEYFGEGVQSYFNVNAYSATPNGIHNHVNTRAKLYSYDRTLYNLIKEIFPCGNIIVDRCDRSGIQPTMKKDCDKPKPKTTPTTPPMTTGTPPLVITPGVTKAPPPPGQTTGTPPLVISTPGNPKTPPPPPPPITTVPIVTKPKPATCVDSHVNCVSWWQRGECTRNPAYMNIWCKKSCNQCCSDKNNLCPSWANKGECTKNPNYMNGNCKKSCKLC